MIGSDVSNAKFFSGAGKDYKIAAFFDLKDEGKKVKNSAILTKREEVAGHKTWDKEQNSMLRKIFFFFQEIHAKLPDADPSSSLQEAGLGQMIVQVELFVHNLLGSLANTIEVGLKENSKLSKKMLDMQESMKNIEETFRKKNQLEYERLEKAKKEAEHSFKHKDIVENTHYFAVQKLQNENDYLKGRLQELIAFSDSQKLGEELDAMKIDLKTKSDRYEGVIQSKESVISRYEIMLYGIKKMNEELTTTNKTIHDKAYLLESDNEKNKKVLQRLQEERNMYRERSLMQLADFEALLGKHETLQEFMDKLKDRLVVEKERNNPTHKQANNPDDVELDENVFRQEIALLELFKNTLFTGSGRQFNMKKTRAIETSDKDVEKEKEKGKAKDKELDLRNYMLSRPGYLFFFQKDKVYEKMKNVKFTHNFLATIRAIFDSKYNETLYAEDYKSITRFADFLYSWMGKFIVDVHTRKIRTADIKDPDPDILRCEMIALLQSPISVRLWECIMFKEFMDEYHTRDELVYFLKCRNLLFRGSQLSDPSATFTYIYYVKLERTDQVIEQLYGAKHSREAVNLMKTKFKERAKVKNQIPFVDSAFFLRVLLEEYKKEKADRFAIYKKTWAEDPDVITSHSNGKMNIPFETFKNLCDITFPEVSDLDKAELYRRLYMFSLGSVDIDHMLTLFNEENLFTKVMKFPNLDEKFVQKGPGVNPATSQKQLENIYELVVEQYNKMDDEMDFLLYGLAQLGVERFITEYNEFKKRVKSHFRIEVRGSQGRDIHLCLMNFASLLYRLSHIYSSSHAPKNELEVQNQIIDIFTNISDTLSGSNLLEDEERRDFELNLKAKKLQKFFKSKLSSWYKLMNFIIKNKLKGIENKMKR